MIKKVKNKVHKIIIPYIAFICNTSVVFATDEFTRKMNNGKLFVMGVLEVAAAINLGIAIYKAGAANTQSEVDSTTRYRKNAIYGFVGITMLNVFIGLWNSW